MLRNEPLARPEGTPHVLRYAHRRGGRAVYVHGRTGQMISEADYVRLSGRKRRNIPRLTRRPLHGGAAVVAAAPV